MDTLTVFMPRVIEPPLAMALRTLGFLADLRTVFRSAPHHTYAEAAIRGSASLHLAILRWVAKLRARVVDRGGKVFVQSSTSASSCSLGKRCNGAPKASGKAESIVFGEQLSRPLLADLQNAQKTLPAFLGTEDGREVRFRHGVDKSDLFDMREKNLMSHEVFQEYATNPTWL